ncbi:MAG: 2-amino-4-hydroxy-6-hydroxymethyldihydropteridine diphosphokinase [Cyclobacteriaceae bacterium]|nr:2-amino-4-hydroxy-6-hydroxymethyldihydropteridine diphosphokinase [Cyclobacteriaceae bacterium]
MKTHIYFLLLGSNQRGPYHQLNQACIVLRQEAGQILSISRVYQTAAWGMTKQDDFLNQVICMKSEYSPHEMLDCIQKIENSMGRERNQKWGPRIIDIDILYADNEIIQTKQLIIPHPEIQNRRFTLIPLCELAPDFVHPILGKSNQQLLETCKDLLPVNLYMLDTST